MEVQKSLLNKDLLVCLLFLATSVALCNAFCLTTLMKKTLGPGCKDGYRIIHPVNSKWKTDNCLDCSCNKNGMTCCTTFAVPVEYNKIKCRAIFHREDCTYDVVERQDPRRECIVYFWRQ